MTACHHTETIFAAKYPEILYFEKNIVEYCKDEKKSLFLSSNY